MSFILDALKKSDAERQRNTGPTLAETPRRYGPPRRPWWVFALGGLLLINLIIFSVVLLRSPRLSTAAAPAPGAEIAKAPAPVAAAPVNSAPPPAAPPAPNPVAAAPAEPPRSLADEAAISPPTEAEQAAFQENLAAASAVPNRAPIVRPSAASGAAQSTGGANQESLPTINDLTGRAASGLPELHLDLHVYATSAQSRFVSINGHKYTEGQKLNEGPTLERITRDGVVLNHQGLRFILPRQ